MKSRFFGIIIILISILSSCQNIEDEEVVLARAFDKKLYLKDININFPANLSEEDSLKILSDYVNQWVNNEVLLTQAEKNVFVDELDIGQRVEDYRRTLIIHEYKQKLVSQRLDTNIAYEEAKSYYESNPDDFKLKENIVKIIYLKLPRNDNNLLLVRRLLRSYDEEEDYEKLKDIAERNAVNYFMAKDNWLLFDDILLEVPINTSNQAQYLKNHSFIELKDDDFVYFIKIQDYKLSGDVSPLSFEYSNVLKIIINKRKIDLLKKMESDIKNNALNYGHVDIFLSEN